jgi:hypothetical protein
MSRPSEFSSRDDNERRGRRDPQPDRNPAPDKQSAEDKTDLAEVYLPAVGWGTDKQLLDGCVEQVQAGNLEPAVLSGIPKRLHLELAWRLRSEVDEIALLRLLPELDEGVHHEIMRDLVSSIRSELRSLLVDPIYLGRTKVDHSSLVNWMLGESADHAMLVIANCAHFNNVDFDYVAQHALRSPDTACILADNIERFKGVDRLKIVRALMDSSLGAFEAVYRNLEKFPELDHRELIERWQKSHIGMSIVAEDPGKINPAISLKELTTILARKDKDTVSVLVDNIARYGHVDYRDLAYEILERGPEFARCAVTLMNHYELHGERLDIPAQGPSSVPDKDEWCWFIMQNMFERGDEYAHALASYGGVDSDRLIDAGPASRKALMKMHFLHFSDSPEDNASKIPIELLTKWLDDERENVFAVERMLLERVNFFAKEDQQKLLEIMLARGCLWGGGEIEMFEVQDPERLAEKILTSDLREKVVVPYACSPTISDQHRRVKEILIDRLDLTNHEVLLPALKHLVETELDTVLSWFSTLPRYTGQGQKIAEFMISDFDDAYLATVVVLPKYFPEIDQTGLVLQLIEKNPWICGDVFWNSDALLDVDFSEVALRVVDSCPREVAENMSLFERHREELLIRVAAAGEPGRALKLLYDPSFESRPDRNRFCLALAKGYIKSGKFETVDQMLGRGGVTRDELVQYLANSLTSELDRKQGNALLRIAAWVAGESASQLLLELSPEQRRFDEYLRVFNPRGRASKVDRAACRLFGAFGVEFFDDLGLLNEEQHRKMVLEIAPRFLEDGPRTDKAWGCLFQNAAGNIDGRRKPRNVREQLLYVLEVHRNMPNLVTPYHINRACHLISNGAPLNELAPNALKERGDVLVRQLIDDSAGLSDLFSRAESRIHDALLLERILGGEYRVSFEQMNLDKVLLADRISAEVKECEDRYSRFVQDLENGVIAPLDSRLVGKRFEFSADCVAPQSINEWQIPPQVEKLVSRVQEALTQGRSSASAIGVEESKATIVDLLTTKIEAIEKRLNQAQPQQQDKIAYQIQKVWEGIDAVNSASDRLGLLQVLCQHHPIDSKSIKEKIAELAISIAISGGSVGEKEYRLIGHELSSATSLASLGEFFQERVIRYFADKLDVQSLKLLEGYLCTPVNDELRKLSHLATHGSEEFIAVPTRGFLGEMSGYIAGTCWTRVTSLMRTHPHIIPVVFIKKNLREGEPLRLEGACLLMRLQDDEGDDVLVIRGLNPSRSVLWGLSAGSFFEQFLERVAIPMAQALDIEKVAIPTYVPESYFQTQSNRPPIFLYLRDRCRGLERVTFRDNRDKAIFNGNSFEDDCVLLWSKPR